MAQRKNTPSCQPASVFGETNFSQKETVVGGKGKKEDVLRQLQLPFLQITQLREWQSAGRPRHSPLSRHIYW